jgi:hypothetical protein
MFERESQEKRMARDPSQNGARGNGEQRGRKEKKGDESSGEGSSVTRRRNGAKKGEVSVSDSADEGERIEMTKCDVSDTTKLEIRKRKALQKKKSEIHGSHGLRKREEGSCRKRGWKPSKQREGKKKQSEGKKRKRGDTSKDRLVHEKRQREAEWEGVVVQIVNDTESVWKTPRVLDSFVDFFFLY